jgi:hypothetical protein
VKRPLAIRGAATAAAAAAALLCAGLMARTEPVRRPQALAGGDILSVLLGDAKKDLSGAMVREADSYFHGGVADMHDLQHHHHEHGEECHDEHCHDEHHHHEHGDDEGHDEDDHDEDEHDEARRPDPWRWINDGVRAPEVHRHLDGERAVELMPWFWVAAKSDPHNVEAWSSAFFVASHMLKDDDLALRIATEGRRLNPASVELAATLGNAWGAEGVRDAAKAEEQFRAAVDLAGAKETLDDNESVAFFDAVSHLADSARERKDAPALAGLLEAARRVDPDHPTVLFVGRTLDELRGAAPPAP